ncbi:DUF4254 domain-containing protein [Nocardia uniformis]|uniref:DUF4254 domain-containing protein n=1 Tax=Nocardia uniformis TaxID=53432 RepID=A0A849BXL9_9NOCA|nr:DUF4254 domain-containing protein [Nocardia uniformis]NNH71024.1 DUF4254 domain-containing protein [Nocardia uniformis]
MEPFPSKNRMLAACRGDTECAHPLLRWACELSKIHQQLLDADESMRTTTDQRRTALVRDIDQWIARELPPALGCARLHTETMGTVIDRLAKFTASANAALTSTAEVELWDSWERLAELAVGYEDLKDEISCGRRRLPYAQ